MLICYCGHWLSESRTVELNYWKGHCLKAKEMFDYKTVSINPLHCPLSLVPIPLMPGSMLASQHIQHRERRIDLVTEIRI